MPCWLLTEDSRKKWEEKMKKAQFLMSAKNTYKEKLRLTYPDFALPRIYAWNNNFRFEKLKDI